MLETVTVELCRCQPSVFGPGVGVPRTRCLRNVQQALIAPTNIRLLWRATIGTPPPCVELPYEDTTIQAELFDHVKYYCQ
jgi:hypothetical protein